MGVEQREGAIVTASGDVDRGELIPLSTFADQLVAEYRLKLPQMVQSACRTIATGWSIGIDGGYDMRNLKVPIGILTRYVNFMCGEERIQGNLADLKARLFDKFVHEFWPTKRP